MPAQRGQRTCSPRAPTTYLQSVSSAGFQRVLPRMRSATARWYLMLAGAWEGASHLVPPFQLPRRPLRKGGRDGKPEGIGDPIDETEQGANVDDVYNGLVAHPCSTHGLDIFRLYRLWGEGQLLQVAQRCPQPIINRRRAPICQDGLGERIAKNV